MCSKKVEFEKVSSTNFLMNTKYLSCKFSARSKGPTSGFSLKCLHVGRITDHSVKSLFSHCVSHNVDAAFTSLL